MDGLINRLFGQYRIIEPIRQGGMSTIYKAYQESLDRYVAIKVLTYNSDPQFVARFKREARAIAQLQHPNILPIYDSNEQDGMLYLVMQYIENGTTLGDLLDAPIESGRALRLVGKVLDALSYAHDRGIIHRDIKPANVLLPSPDWPMLADFGIVALRDADQNLTRPGLAIGPAAYMAPAQARGELEEDHAGRCQSAADMAADCAQTVIRMKRSGTSQLTRLYPEGLRALADGHLDLAIARFGQIAVIDPAYQDSAALLDVARSAQLRSRTEARQQLEQMRQRGTQEEHLRVPPTAPQAAEPAQPAAANRAAPPTKPIDAPAIPPPATPVAIPPQAPAMPESVWVRQRVPLIIGGVLLVL